MPLILRDAYSFGKSGLIAGIMNLNTQNEG
jgi:hypothetical protein